MLVPAPIARGARGAVVAPHHLATGVGLTILAGGGSAVDAAIATNAALAVVMPNGCGLGGDAFWLIWDEATGVLTALNGSGRSPAGASAESLRARGMNRIPSRGPLSITVPGAVRSWGDAHARHGRLPLATDLAPAIELAGAGFPAWPGFIDAVEASAPLAADELGRGAAPWLSTYRPDGRPWRPGELVRLPALARTFGRLADEGTDVFYDGDLGERQARALVAAGAPFTADDFRAHTSTWGEPIGIDYRGVRALSHPPNSSGVVALQLLSILGALDPPHPDAFGPAGVADPHWIHLGVEAAKLAMRDRDATLTDPEARAVPVDHLLDPGYARELARDIDASRASTPHGLGTLPRGGGTIYLATVDAAGNAVSLIQSNYLGFGSLVVDAGTGIHYQDRGAYFSLDPDHPNVLAPRKRTLHTLLPGMLARDGRPWVVLGSMGGDAQPQVFAQLVSALVDGGVDVATTVAAPRWFIDPEDHFQPPEVLRIEPRFAPDAIDALVSMGHRVVPAAPFDPTLGHAHAIELVDGGPATGGSLAAATGPRSAGLPAAR
jgi:gamma-glutamyltranspeptidase/glutathione hydrolase